MTMMFYVKEENKGLLKYDLDDENYKLIENIIKEYINEFTVYNYHEGIRRFNRIAELGNLYINDKKIYNICKLESKKNEIIMGNALFIAWVVGELAEPIMPNKSKRIKQLFNNKNSDNALLNLPQKGEIEISFEDTSLLFNQVKEEDFVKVFEMIKQNKV
jgi:methionyl-tRNA synthetase